MGKLHFKRQYWQHFQSCQKEAEDLSAIRAPIVLVIPTPAMVPAKDTDTPMRTVASTSTRGKGTGSTPALLGVRSLPMDSGTLPPTTTTMEPATPRQSRSTRTVRPPNPDTHGLHRKHTIMIIASKPNLDPFTSVVFTLL